MCQNLPGSLVTNSGFYVFLHFSQNISTKEKGWVEIQDIFSYSLRGQHTLMHICADPILVPRWTHSSLCLFLLMDKKKLRLNIANFSDAFTSVWSNDPCCTLLPPGHFIVLQLSKVPLLYTDGALGHS